jgi:nucleoside-diphosphate-sugar epimerase
VHLIEEACGRRADVAFIDRPPGDVPATWADITSAKRDLGYAPAIPLAEGVASHVAWHKAWRTRTSTSPAVSSDQVPSQPMPSSLCTGP